jgi:hypothetical protein
MGYKEEIEKFVVAGYKNVRSKLETDGKHNFVLNDRNDNFITSPEKFKYHRWAGSLKSSQAFAYNIFSGMKNRTFEFPMPVLGRDAQIDVKIDDVKAQTIELFEVKMFEIVKMGKIEFGEKYDDTTNYKSISKDKDIADAFIKFKNEVIKHFSEKKIYGNGIKQLCSHLLGILNVINTPDYENKKIKLYSFCFDFEFSDKFKKDIDNYKNAIGEFKCLAYKFLKNIEITDRVEYCGFLSAREYVENNKDLLGVDNYKYVKKRYFFEI